MQSKTRSRGERKVEVSAPDRLFELFAILGAFLIAVAIGALLESFILGFVAVIVLAGASLIAMRLWWSRPDRTNSVGPRRKSAHAQNH
jgi:membrane protein implicated in regulation of membrane protease activity